MTIQNNVHLSQLTTLQLGGSADYFATCTSSDELLEILTYAKTKGLRVQILGGGSNTIFSDDGFRGLVVKIAIKGITFTESGDYVHAAVKSGEEWDTFVRSCVDQGLGGIECLSGIPGLVGATPIQNVGAYGQEVKETIQSVTAVERATNAIVTFSNSDCRFSYRQSRFKQHDANRYVITEVTFRLAKDGRPELRYPELKKIADATLQLSELSSGKESLETVRSIVLSLRRKKSMVIDPADPNSRSVGSFFLNPIVDQQTLLNIAEQWKSIGDGTTVPSFPSEGKVKIPAAWLIEKSGFKKGYKKNGVGISENHTLALVNYGGTVAALLSMAKEVQDKVLQVFGVTLEREANVIV